ncbi:hypothetical protein [Dyella choica]|uniref:Uncharacterized protein n=1 Tax=Dyella choica TaxID=1927959 RepID=A0A3S0PJT4_9GAMM|nr:hypothetical protein [Dyella choica]RUL77660.1 hypothetical protein EKH80_07235 [Dyella choica]
MASSPQEPMEAGAQTAQLCKPSEIDAVAEFLNLLTLEWKSDDGEPRDSILVAAACKANPAARGQTIVAVAYDAGKQDSKALGIILLDNGHQRVLADYQGEIGEDPMMSVRTGSLWIDTANYALTEGVRAFAVDQLGGYSPNCGDGGVGPSRNLYVREGRRIRPVLNAMYMSYWEFIRRGQDRCNSDADPDAPTVIGDTTLSLAMAPTSSHGYRDLLVTATFSRDDKRAENDERNPKELSPLHYVLHYDGKQYNTDIVQLALSCGACWLPPAIVVKATPATAASTKAAAIPFLPSMQVQMVVRKPDAILVQHFGDEAHLNWLPRDALAQPSDFKPLTAWHGQASLQVKAEYLGDIGGTYRFLPDGGFTLDLEEAQRTTVRITGHLYTYGPVLKAHWPAGDEYLWLQADGKLCALNRAGKCK